MASFAVPETAANVYVGGTKLNRLFVWATTTFYSAFLDAAEVSPA